MKCPVQITRFVLLNIIVTQSGPTGETSIIYTEYTDFEDQESNVKMHNH